MALNPAMRFRHQAGTSVGGRFAPQSHSEGDVSLHPAGTATTGQTAADWFDEPVQPDPVLPRIEAPAANPAAELIAARILAGHALVKALRAHAANPELAETREMLTRAELAVQAATTRLGQNESPRMGGA